MNTKLLLKSRPQRVHDHEIQYINELNHGKREEHGHGKFVTGVGFYVIHSTKLILNHADRVSEKNITFASSL